MIPSTSREYKHLSEPLWWWYDRSCLPYKKCRPYKNFKFKAQIGGLFCKTLESCYRNKSPDSHSAGVRAIPNKQLAQQESRKLRRKFLLLPRGQKSLQHSRNYNQESHWICSKTKTFLTHKNVDLLSGQLKKLQGRYVVNLKVMFTYEQKIWEFLVVPEPPSAVFMSYTWQY